MDESYKLKCNARFRSLGVKNSLILTEYINKNSKISDGTLFCYKFFFSIMTSSSSVSKINQDFKNEYDQLKIILTCVQCLKKNNKFNTYLFGKYLMEDFSKLPLEIVWWLNKNDIMSLAQFCNNTNYLDLPKDLINILKVDEQHPIFIAQEIVEDVFVELVRGYYQPYISVSKLAVSQSWLSYCTHIICDVLEKIVQVIIVESDETFFNCLAFFRSYLHFLPIEIVKRFHLQILHQLMQYNTEDFDLYSSYAYQEFWCSKALNKSLYAVYEEMFMQICNMSDIVNFIEENEEIVNWKYTLAAVAVCTKISATGPADVKEVALNLLTESFKGGKVKQFIKGLLIIRQACLENNMQMDYATWYSTTFGHNSNFKTTQVATIFHFYINTLTSLISFEPLSYLTTHISCAISAPPKCNYLVHDYKALCKSRVKELTKFPYIFVNGVSINVLYVIEECVRMNAPTYTYCYFSKRSKHFRDIVESQHFEQQSIYRKFIMLF